MDLLVDGAEVLGRLDEEKLESAIYPHSVNDLIKSSFHKYNRLFYCLPKLAQQLSEIE